RAVGARDTVLDEAQRIALSSLGERHVLEYDGTVLGQDRSDEGVSVFAAPTPDLFVRRAEVDQLAAVRADHEEDLAHALRHLAEPLLTLAQRRLGSLPLDGRGDHAGGGAERFNLGMRPLALFRAVVQPQCSPPLISDENRDL